MIETITIALQRERSESRGGVCVEVWKKRELPIGHTERFFHRYAVLGVIPRPTDLVIKLEEP